MNQSTAYRLAYPSCKSNEATYVGASRLLRNAKVQEKVEELQKLTVSEKALTWQKKREMLARIARDPGSTPMEIMAAIKVDNQMAGHDRPPPEEVETPLSLAHILSNLRDTTGLPCEDL